MTAGRVLWAALAAALQLIAGGIAGYHIGTWQGKASARAETTSAALRAVQTCKHGVLIVVLRLDDKGGIVESAHCAEPPDRRKP